MKIWTKMKQKHRIRRAHSSAKEMNSSERGSVVILVALGMTVLLGSVAMVTDVGLIYVQKAKLQNAVDAAALAGVQELPSDSSRADQVAEEYASQNGLVNITTHFENNDLKIVVSAQKTVPTYFAKIWGINSEEISATARALMLPPTSMSGVVPLSVEEQNFEYGALYTLKSGPNDPSKQYSGWFGPLELSGNGAKSYETDLANGYPGTLSIGQIVDVKHGNMSGPTQQGIEARIAQDTRVPRNTFDNYERYAPEIMYVPIVHVLDGNGSSTQQVKIVGFAAFFLEGVPGNGNDSIITGRFIKTLVPGSKTEWNLTDLLEKEDALNNGMTVDDFGLYTPKLVEQ